MAIEKFRRHLEESVTAVLDGYAVFQKCATASDVGDPLPRGLLEGLSGVRT